MKNKQNIFQLYGAFSSVRGDRDYQEDQGFVSVEDGKNRIGIICDGIGGLPNGSEASMTAVQKFLEEFITIDKSQEDYSTFLKKEMHRLDARVHGMADKNGRALSAGTTLVAVVIDEEMLSWVSVGDSKIYIVRDNMMVQCNREHNYLTILNEMLKDGLINLDTYNEEIYKGDSLTSFIGMGNLSQIDVNPNPFHLLKNDVVLLCSDGLSKLLMQDEILSVIRRYRDNLEKVLEELQNRAQKKAKTKQVIQDNTTLAIFSYQEKKEKEKTA